MTYLVSHVVQFIFVKKMGRQFSFPTLIQINDFVLLGASIVMIEWLIDYIQKNTYVEDENEAKMRLVANFSANIEFPFSYIFAVCIVCLILRIFSIF